MPEWRSSLLTLMVITTPKKCKIKFSKKWMNYDTGKEVRVLQQKNRFLSFFLIFMKKQAEGYGKAPSACFFILFPPTGPGWH